MTLPDEASTEPSRVLRLTLHADAVAYPAHKAALLCREVIDLYFDALSKMDLSQPPPAPEGTFFRFSFASTSLSADQRRSMHQHWVLAKAFQDLLRGVRGSLEKAYFFLQLLEQDSISAASDTTLDALLAPFREEAQNMNFPDLMGRVNSRLKEPLAFAESYRTLQAARNCLEHRDGIVGRKDVNPDGVLRISIPRMKLFVERAETRLNFIRIFGPKPKLQLKFG